MKIVCVIAGIIMFVFWILLFVCLNHLDDSKLIGTHLFVIDLLGLVVFGLTVFAIMLSLTNSHGTSAMYANYLAGGFAIPMGVVMAMAGIAIFG